MSGVHRSRISTISIDVPGDDREVSELFWSGATGLTSRPATSYSEYTVIGDAHGYRILLQALEEGEPGVHLDVHTDNLECEVERLTALGATEVNRMENWVVMCDPVGVIFCVCESSTDDPSLDGATSWP